MKGEDVDHQDAFTTETAGLPEASSPSVVRLYDGDSFDLRIHPVRNRIGDAEVRMLGRNGALFRDVGRGCSPFLLMAS